MNDKFSISVTLDEFGDLMERAARKAESDAQDEQRKADLMPDDTPETLQKNWYQSKTYQLRDLQDYYAKARYFRFLGQRVEASVGEQVVLTLDDCSMLDLQSAFHEEA
jgi:hypothetical protein